MKMTLNKKRRLDLSLLKKKKAAGNTVTAQCPACAQAGEDKTGNHLVVFGNGKWGCVVNPGPAGRHHRREIFKLVGETERRTEQRYVKVKGWARVGG